jgi:heptose-I-phosphate ethanolaminephosphotransferase
MLSLQPINNWAVLAAEKSIVGAFDEANFKTYWFSAQEADSWGGIIPLVAAEAKHRRYFDRALDGALLDPFRSVLQGMRDGEKLFIVLHTKGSHFDFSRRYPTEFSRFDSPGGSHRETLRDTYDNSILYTDWFLSEVIAALRRSEVNSALFYASDHGENLLDDDRQLFGHAIGNGWDLPTASFDWVSDSLRERQPEQIRTALSNANTPLTLSNLPHSLLDLAGLEAQGLDKTSSIFSKSFSAGPRWYIVRGELKQAQATGAVR